MSKQTQNHLEVEMVNFMKDKNVDEEKMRQVLDKHDNHQLAMEHESRDHPDTQLTTSSRISQRSFHLPEALFSGHNNKDNKADTTIDGHNIVQISELGSDVNLGEEEHKSAQLTVRSVRQMMTETFNPPHHNDYVEDTKNENTTVEQEMVSFEKANMNAIELAWQDLSVFSATHPCPSGDGKKVLLNKASGKAHGSFMAIMGPSGSGKTTLMNVLACRGSKGIDVEGGGLINGEKYDLSTLKSCSGYVMQDDLMNGMLTVFETLYFAAELRLPHSVSKEDKIKRVNEVIDMLGLSICRSTIIGDHMHRGISGGQRKRVSVGIELLARPRLLFLDEPTSGLDSVSAASLCALLRDLAHSGECTIITTIHQPQTKIFHMFDDLILLKAGKIFYYGGATEVTDFFAECGFPCPNHTNPADWVLDVITDQPHNKDEVEAAERKLLEMGGSVVEGQEEEKNKRKELAQKKYTKKVFHHNARGVSWVHQFYILMIRCFKEQLRAWDLFLTLLVQNIIMALLIGGIFSALITINQFPRERTLVLRERAAGTYNVSAYFLAKNISDLVSQILPPLVYSCIVYFMVGFQNDAGKFFIFTLFMIFGSMAATSVALMVSAICRTTEASITILPMVLEVSRLFGGFFQSPSKMEDYFKWLDVFSYVQYCYVGITINELSGLQGGDQRLTQLGMDGVYSVGMCFGYV
eukprot:Pgem_evm1s17427